MIASGLRINVYQPQLKNDSGPETSTTRLFRYGERLRFPARISAPRNYRNPGAFDYRGYLAENGIVALASTKTASVEVLPGFAGSRVEFWRARVHRSVIDRVHALWPPRQAALMDAMVIGEDAFINRPTRADFQRSGTYHVLVVSGMNVSILALVTFWFLRRLRISDLLAGAITVVLMLTYATSRGRADAHQDRPPASAWPARRAHLARSTAAAILTNFRPWELWVSDPSDPEMKALLRQAQELGVRVVQRQAGDEFDFGGAEVRILAPAAQDLAARRNDESLVMKLVYKKTSALLEGDAEKRSEQQVAEEHPEADLLKVAHHISATSTNPLLLDRVHPRFAAISVGARNTYGHPRGEVLARLGEAGVMTYRTDLDGAVTFYLDGTTVIPGLPRAEVH